MQHFVSGLDWYNLALFLNRVVVGVFFVVYRFRWFYDPSQIPARPWFSQFRRDKLKALLSQCGYGGGMTLCATLATVEVAAGLALIIGLLTVPAAVGLIVILLFANACSPKLQLPNMKPVDRLDCVSCLLQLPEPLYLVMAVNVLLMGPGEWSLDALWVRAFQ